MRIAVAPLWVLRVEHGSSCVLDLNHLSLNLIKSSLPLVPILRSLAYQSFHDCGAYSNPFLIIFVPCDWFGVLLCVNLLGGPSISWTLPWVHIRRGGHKESSYICLVNNSFYLVFGKLRKLVVSWEPRIFFFLIGCGENHMLSTIKHEDGQW